jgi:hypothetical protein
MRESGPKRQRGRALANLASLANARADRAKAIELATESVEILMQLRIPDASHVAAFLKSLTET